MKFVCFGRAVIYCGYVSNDNSVSSRQVGLSISAGVSSSDYFCISNQPTNQKSSCRLVYFGQIVRSRLVFTMYWNLRYLEDSENGFVDTGEFPLLGETKRLLYSNPG